MKISVAVVSLMLTSPLALAYQADFIPLGVLHAGDGSEAHAVSADGSVVVGSSGVGLAREAFRWTTAGGLVGLGDLPGGAVLSVATGVSANGKVVVGFSESQSGREAFMWSEETGMVGLGDLPGGLFGSEAGAVSADGSTVVGGAQSSVGPRAFIWTAASGMQALSGAAGIWMEHASGVSADGSVVSGSGPSIALRWTASGGFEIVEATTGSTAQGMSPNGDFVVGHRSGFAGIDGFLWAEGAGSMSLGGSPGTTYGNSPVAVDREGGVVAINSLGFMPNDKASMWTSASGQVVLVEDYLLGHGAPQVTGWNLNYCGSVSLDGKVIVGGGISPSGVSEAWVAHLEPVTMQVVSSSFCLAQVPNSSGQAAFLVATGSEYAHYNYVSLHAQQLPTNQFGYFLGATGQMSGVIPPGSSGNLCLGGMLARFNRPSEIRGSGVDGTMGLDLNLLDFPTNPVQSVLAGQSWYFQCWFRDSAAGASSNFTDGAVVAFQ